MKKQYMKRFWGKVYHFIQRIALHDIYEKIIEMAKLKENWDGYHAPEIDKQCLVHATNIVSAMHNKMFICPTGRGTIQIEWEDEDNNYIEIEIWPSGECKAFYMSGEELRSKTTQQPISIQAEQITADFIRAEPIDTSGVKPID